MHKYGLIFGVELARICGLYRRRVRQWPRAGANCDIKLSAGSEYLGKAEYRRNLVVSSQSARCIAGLCILQLGPNDVFHRLVFPGHLLIAENGSAACGKGAFQLRFSNDIYRY
jgi:hypothetical protein